MVPTLLSIYENVREGENCYDYISMIAHK